MSRGNRTYRVVDGQRIEGTWRPIFIRNGGSYFLTDLKIFADGAIDCWGTVDLDGLRAKLASGWIATTIEPNARGSAHDLADWQFLDPQVSINPDDFVVQVADAIDRLNNRPDSTGRCRQLIADYVSSRDESDRRALAEAYLQIPASDRRYALGDMDYKDWPLRVICTAVDEPMVGDDGLVDGEVVTEKMRDEAFDYFIDRQHSEDKWANRRAADEPEHGRSGPITSSQVVYPRGWPEDAGVLVLRNEFPAPITYGDEVYPTLVHAYWALSTQEPEIAEQIRQAERPYDAEQVAATGTRHPQWSVTRSAVMAALLRAKFAQYPEFAEQLIATGDSPIYYQQFRSLYWGSDGEAGTNWVGRLLELVRAEIACARSGLLLAL
ncbi:NADAR family protein [Nocardia sp. NPDC060249]|uniref:NADAR family protein n=1 Tax=Nocardia sp. NPDC060249 TaxID=3347082 RepID=UPI00365C7E6E